MPTHLSTLALVLATAAPLSALSQPAAPKAAASAASAAAPAASQAVTTTALKPGLWEMTTVVENAAANSRRQLVARSCITAADASNPQRVVPVQREAGLTCENRDLKREGANWVWAFSCKGADAAEAGNGKLSILGDRFLGRAEAELRTKGAKPVKLVQTFSGQWMKACS